MSFKLLITRTLFTVLSCEKLLIGFVFVYVFLCAIGFYCLLFIQEGVNDNIDTVPSIQSMAQAQLPFLTEEEIFSRQLRTHDDPQLLHYLRENVLIPPPSDKNLKVILSKQNPHKNPTEQEEIYRFVFNLLGKKKNGFFIEVGANDGELFSNTLPLEVHHIWSGLLIEPDPQPLTALRKRNRNAWIAPVCLSEKMWPTKVQLIRRNNDDLMTHLDSIHEHDYSSNSSSVKFSVSCYPLYSILKAINITVIDYFSLDVEGMEYFILKTIPWKHLVINVISIEVPIPTITSHPSVERNNLKIQKKINTYMKSVGYVFVSFINNSYSHDNIYRRESMQV